jgi:TonB family protein
LAVPLCPATFNDSLETDGIASKVDKNVRLPMPRYQPEAEFSDAARRLNGALEFNVVIGLVVNADGDTQELCLVRSAGYGLDANAANTVGRYRFVPAARDGKPVAYRISIEVYFRRYGGR